MEISGECAGRHGLTRTRRTYEKEAAEWRESLRLQAILLPLLKQYSVKARRTERSRTRSAIRVSGYDTESNPASSPRGLATGIGRPGVVVGFLSESTRFRSSWAKWDCPPRAARAATCRATE